MVESSIEIKTKQAVNNNIALCECIAVANGIQPGFIDGVWMSSRPMPPYYPNLITTQPNLNISHHIEHLKEVLALEWGIKDSFSEHDLLASGFRVAVSGCWFSMCGNANTRYFPSEGSSVITVRSGTDFKRWISAWDSPMDGKIFPHDIWCSKDLEFVFVERENQLMGGFLLNRTSNNVGVSNWFGKFDLVNWALRKVISPSQCVVGYADDRELNELTSFGFERLQAMKVWICN